MNIFGRTNKYFKSVCAVSVFCSYQSSNEKHFLKLRNIHADNENKKRNLIPILLIVNVSIIPLSMVDTFRKLCM